MAKKRRLHSRSTSPHTNAPMQHTPAGIMQRTTKVVANAATTAARQLMSSGSKAMQRNKNQGSDATVQQGDASTAANALSANAPDNSNSSANTAQEYGAMDPNASMLSDLGSRAPRFVANRTSRSSPSIGSQTTTPAVLPERLRLLVKLQLPLQVLFFIAVKLRLLLQTLFLLGLILALHQD